MFFFVCSVCISVLLCFFLSISISALYTIWVYNNLFKLNNMYTKHQPTKEWKKRTKTHTQMLLQGREQSVENQKCTKMNIQLKYPMYEGVLFPYFWREKKISHVLQQQQKDCVMNRNFMHGFVYIYKFFHLRVIFVSFFSCPPAYPLLLSVLNERVWLRNDTNVRR